MPIRCPRPGVREHRLHRCPQAAVVRAVAETRDGGIDPRAAKLRDEHRDKRHGQRPADERDPLAVDARDDGQAELGEQAVHQRQLRNGRDLRRLGGDLLAMTARSSGEKLATAASRWSWSSRRDSVSSVPRGNSQPSQEGQRYIQTCSLSSRHGASRAAQAGQASALRGASRAPATSGASFANAVGALAPRSSAAARQRQPQRRQPPTASSATPSNGQASGAVMAYCPPASGVPPSTGAAVPPSTTGGRPFSSAARTSRRSGRARLMT